MHNGLLMVSTLAVAFHSCDGPPIGSRCADHTQFGGDQTHQNATCVVGQELERQVDSASYDPFVPQEAAESDDALPIHYQSPLMRGDELYMSRKAGTYVSCNPPGSGQPAPCGPDNIEHLQWTLVAYHNQDGRLSERWTYVSDWKPLNSAVRGGGLRFEQVFHAALGHHLVYVPGAGGTVHALELTHGREVARVNPFGSRDATPDPSYHVAGPLTIDSADNLYYNVVQRDDSGTRASYLVRVSAGGEVRTVDYDSLTPGAPAPTDLCRGNYVFGTTPRPWPPLDASGAVIPPTPVACGRQAPPVDLAPALSADGRTLYTASGAAGDPRYAYLIAVRTADLSLRWNRSLRGLVNDGCGVLITRLSPCSIGAPPGIDPNTGEAPAGTVPNGVTSSPVVLPDGAILLASYTTYNYGRGHLFKLAPDDGHFLASFDFGSDITPAVWRHDGTYSIVTKDNHYFDNILTTGAGPYYVTQLDPDLKIEWRARSSETKSCKRRPDGSVTCIEDPENANGFEWCINQPAIDALGNVFVTSEDGNTYHIAQGGQIVARQFLDEALGSAYTPTTLDMYGHTVSLNAGTLSVLGRRQ